MFNPHFFYNPSTIKQLAILQLTYLCTMDIQFVLMIVVFALALAYVGRIIYRSIAAKKDSCATGCGKCSADFSKIPDNKS